MRPLAVELTRWTIAALFAGLAFALVPSAPSAVDFVCLVVVGGIALVLIVSLGWINAAPRRDE